MPSPVKAVERAAGSAGTPGAWREPGWVAVGAARRLRRRRGRRTSFRTGVDPRRVRRGARTSRRRPGVDDLTTLSAASRRCWPPCRTFSCCCPSNPRRAQADAIADIRSSTGSALPPGFVTATGPRIWPTCPLPDRGPPTPRAVAACDSSRPGTDGAGATRSKTPTTNWFAGCRQHEETAPDVRDIARQIEELRVSLWAQQLGTPRPVSEQRIYRAIDDAANMVNVGASASGS